MSASLTIHSKQQIPGPQLNYLVRERAKICIIGAGLSGLLTARLLRENYGDKVDLSILEADERLGGRIHTSPKYRPDGPVLEAGAEFVNEDHGLIRSLCNDLSLELIPSYQGAADAAPPFATIYKQKIRDDFKDLVKKVGEAVRRDRAKILTDQNQKLEFARMSAAHYIDQLHLAGDDAELLKLFVHTEQAVKLGEMSALFLLEWMDFETFGEGHTSLFAAGDDKYRIQGGSGALIDALAQPLHNTIRPAVSVSGIFGTSSGKARVNTYSELPEYFDAVVLAVPATVVSQLDVSPGELATLKEQSGKIHYSSVSKTLVTVNGELPWALQKYHQVLDLNVRGLLWGTGQNSAVMGGRSYIAIYQGGDNVGYKSGQKNSVETIKIGLAELFRAGTRIRMNDCPSPSLVNMTSHVWPNGGWNMPRRGRGGSPAAFLRALRERYNNVFVAGEHVAPENPQTMQGAAESALAAASNIGRFLGLGSKEISVKLSNE